MVLLPRIDSDPGLAIPHYLTDGLWALGHGWLLCLDYQRDLLCDGVSWVVLSWRYVQANRKAAAASYPPHAVLLCPH